MARRREFMMENHLGGSHSSDNENPDMPSNVVSLDDLENVGRMWKERDSIQVGPNNWETKMAKKKKSPEGGFFIAGGSGEIRSRDQRIKSLPLFS